MLLSCLSLSFVPLGFPLFLVSSLLIKIFQSGGESLSVLVTLQKSYHKYIPSLDKGRHALCPMRVAESAQPKLYNAQVRKAHLSSIKELYEKCFTGTYTNNPPRSRSGRWKRFRLFFRPPAAPAEGCFHSLPPPSWLLPGYLWRRT